MSARDIGNVCSTISLLLFGFVSLWRLYRAQVRRLNKEASDAEAFYRALREERLLYGGLILAWLLTNIALLCWLW